MNKYLLTTFFALIVMAAFGQDQEQECPLNLEKAQLRYDEGRIQDIEGLLVSCLNNGRYDKAQSVTALRLMILANIFMEEEDPADSLMKVLLQTSHEFEPDPVLDPTEFINLYNTYNTEPIFNVGFKIGQNWSMQQVDQFHTIGQPGSKYEYSVINGIYASLLFEWSFHDRFYLYPELSYSVRRYSKESEFPGLITDVFSTNEILESYTWLELPVTVQYVLLDNPDWQPYVFAGGSVSYLLASEYPGDLNSRTRTGNSEIKLATVSSLEDRNQINANATVGVGLKRKAGEGFITVELRASYMITNLTKNGNSLTPTNDPDLVHGLWEWYDSFKQHYAAITIGYTKNIYKPKKK